MSADKKNKSSSKNNAFLTEASNAESEHRQHQHQQAMDDAASVTDRSYVDEFIQNEGADEDENNNNANEEAEEEEDDDDEDDDLERNPFSYAVTTSSGGGAVTHPGAPHESTAASTATSVTAADSALAAVGPKSSAALADTSKFSKGSNPAPEEKDTNLDNGNDDDDDELLGDVRAISAVAPKIYQQDEAHIEVSSTPAFQCLEELFLAGKLTGTQVAQLKAKYIELHLVLKKSRENEARLLRESKECLKRLDENRDVLQRADAFPDNLTSEVLKLRAQYLKYENDASCSEERLYNLEYKLAGLEDDKQLFDREYARLPKPHELERRIEQLQQQNGEFSREITQRHEEIHELRAAISDQNAAYEMRKREYKELLEAVENCKNEYVQINMRPNQIVKECDKISTEIDEKIKEKTRISSDMRALIAQLANEEQLLREVEAKNSELSAKIAEKRELSYDNDKKHNDLSTQYEHEKEKEVVLQSDKVTVELSLKHTLAEKKLEYDIFVRAKKEKEKDAKSLKKLELQMKACDDSFTNIKLAYDKIQAQKMQQPSNDGSLSSRRRELEKEVEQLKRDLTKEHSDTNIQKVKVETRIEVEEHMLCEQSDFRIQAVEVTRLAAIKADEKEQKLREFMKAETRYKRALEDIKIKDNLIDEHAKRLRDLKFKLKDFSKMYDIIKGERNKCVNQIQVCTQRAAEMREKIKILSNEIEILRTSSVQKEKQLQKQRLKHSNSVALRDSIQNEVAKQRMLLNDMNDVQSQQKMNINNYNNIINFNERTATQLRKHYNSCVMWRNERGIELITRSEEVCVICEKANAQEAIIKQGNIELVSREEQLKFLRLRADEERRQLMLLTRDVPSVENMQQELKLSRAQLVECQQCLLQLEQKVENCNNPERIRLLSGPDESVEDVFAKLEQVEIKLAKVEEQCLEKDLIIEQVNRLTERITNKVNSSKDDTLQLAKKVNATQGHIKDTTKKMMATVSELSIAQAQALRLHEELKNKELLLEQFYSRMQKGEAPSDEMAKEWQRIIDTEENSKRNKQADAGRQLPDEKMVYTMPDGYATTAEPRPNAYIPQNGNELPLPKPYGRLAPFKPQDPGSSMRHIKKPNPKPIEI